jgi:hypothetical protein
MMAALNESGIVLATSKLLYALTVDDKGVCHLARNKVQHHEVFVQYHNSFCGK